MKDLINKINSIPVSFLTSDQLAELMGVSRSTIYNLQRKGIRVDNDNRVYLGVKGHKIPKEDIILFLREAPLKMKIIA